MAYYVDFTNGPMKAIRFRTGLDFCPYVYYIARMGKYVPRHVQELANSYEKKFRILRTKGGLDKALLDFEIELFKKYKVALVRLNFFDLSFYQDDKIMSTIEGIEAGDLEYVGMFDDYDELDRQTRTLKNKVRDGSEFNENSEDDENSNNDSNDFDVPEEELEGLEEEDLDLLDSEENEQSNEDEEKDLEHLKELSKKGGEKPFFLQEGYDENSDSEEDSEDDEEELDPDMDKFFENFKKFSEQELEKEMSEKEKTEKENKKGE